MKKLITITLMIMMMGTVLPDTSEASSNHTKAISVAKSNLGVKYKWGGTTTKGFDCSGLIKYSYEKAGKKLPRTASQLQGVGKKVTSLKPGDLMFFAPNKGKKATHVSIYIGNGKMIHAASSKGVSIISTKTSYWKTKYIGAKRIN